jgi:DNA polymerase-3 subunit delta'
VQHVLSFALDPGVQFVIVFELAELMSLGAANKLLKSLEEPPPGYHFLLLSETEDALLPTIVSRCIITRIEGAADASRWQSLLQLFSTLPDNALEIFSRDFDRVVPTEFETRGLLDTLLAHWQEQYHAAVAAHDETKAAHAQHIQLLLSDFIARPPMPGSSKLMWRTLLLQCMAS